MELKDNLKKYKEIVDRNLVKYLPNGIPSNLFNSMEYSLVAGGKRIRPILLLVVCDKYGISRDISIPVAVSIEYIHTYSLIHDDLPSMDDDDYRRGKLTNHKVFGEATAILAGDGLLTEAFNIVANINNLNDRTKIEIIKILSHASGPNGMIKGQVLDIENEGKLINESTLMEIHENKTGKLLLAPLLIAALLCNFDEREKKGISDFGRFLGLTFQITDDIIDCCGKFEETGKLVGSDEKKDKATYVSIHGLESAKNIAKDYIEKGITSLRESNIDIIFLDELITYLLNRKG